MSNITRCIRVIIMLYVWLLKKKTMYLVCGVSISYGIVCTYAIRFTFFHFIRSSCVPRCTFEIYGRVSLFCGVLCFFFFFLTNKNRYDLVFLTADIKTVITGFYIQMTEQTFPFRREPFTFSREPIHIRNANNHVFFFNFP